MKLNKQFWAAVAILVGTVIGAGIFGLPYAISQIGFIPGIIYLLLLAGIVLVVNFCFTEVILRTNGHYQMAGYAKKYLGNWGKILLTLSLVLGIYSASAAYLAGIGIFLFNIFQPVIGGSLIIYSVLFWVVISTLIFWGVKFMAKLELIMAILLILVVGVIFIFAFPHLNVNNLTTVDLSHWFFPFGVILFALGGATAIPMMQQLLRKKEILLKKAIIIGLIVPVLIYIIFSFTIIGVTGNNTSEEGIIGLANIVGSKALIIGGFFGIISMATSYLALSFVLKEMFWRDYHLPYFYSWLLTIIVPPLIFLFASQSFVKILGFSGVIFSGFQGILLILMYYRAKKLGERQPAWRFSLHPVVAAIICLIFATALIYQLIYSF